MRRNILVHVAEEILNHNSVASWILGIINRNSSLVEIFLRIFLEILVSQNFLKTFSFTEFPQFPAIFRELV